MGMGMGVCTRLRVRRASLPFALGLLVLATRDAPAQEHAPAPVAVSVEVKGRGQIRLIVSEGTARPCESADNHLLFSGHARVGDEIKLTTSEGSLCVDHTYGTFRESQWAGAAIWSAGDYGSHPEPHAVLHIPVSTDNP
jgi:hypothetical protein